MGARVAPGVHARLPFVPTACSTTEDAGATRMRPRRLRKTVKQTILRRRAAFYTLVQAQEPDEDFVDPHSKRYDETLAELLRAPRGRGWMDPMQLDLWRP